MEAISTMEEILILSVTSPTREIKLLTPARHFLCGVAVFEVAISGELSRLAL